MIASKRPHRRIDHRSRCSGEIHLPRFSKKIYIYAISFFLFLIFCHPYSANAAFTEQVAISSKAVALANTVTANTPGLMSMHYNPAGLSELPEGKTFEQGFTIPYMVKNVKFTADEDFEGFMNTWGPQEGQIHDPLDGTESSTRGNIRMYLPIINRPLEVGVGPSLGLASRAPGSKWTFSYGNYAPYAGGWTYSRDDSTAFGGQSLYQQHMIYAALSASYQLNPSLSLGASVGLGLTAMGAEIVQRAPNEMVALTRVLGDATKDLYIPILSDLTLPPPWFGGGQSPYEKFATLDFRVRDDFTPNYNLGLLWQPKEWFSFGAVYQSEIKTQMTGGFTFHYSEQWQRMTAWNGSSPMTLIAAGMLQLPYQALPYQTGTLTTNYTFPQRVQTGIMIKPTKRLKVMIDLHWADWSVAKETRLTFDQDIQLLQLVKLLGYAEGNRDLVMQNDFEDSLDPSIAIEYQLSKKLTLRCGYSKRTTSVQKELRDLLGNTMPDMNFFGAGVGLTLPNNHKIDLSFGAMINDGKSKIANNTSTNLNSTDFFRPVYNPYAGLDVEQDMAIYLVSLGLSMPFTDFIEQQKHLMHMQHEAIGHLIDLIKKPFSSPKDEDEEEAAEGLH